jgi:hypothetical protein
VQMSEEDQDRVLEALRSELDEMKKS